MGLAAQPDAVARPLPHPDDLERDFFAVYQPLPGPVTVPFN